MDFPSAKTSLQHPMKYALVLVTALFLTRASQAVEGVFPQKYLDSLTPAEAAAEQATLASYLAKRRRTEAEVQKRVDGLLPSFMKGDFSAIDSAAATGDTDMLWALVEGRAVASLACTLYSRQHPSESLAAIHDLEKKLIEDVRNHARPLLAAIPGHAKPLGDFVDFASDRPGYGAQQTAIRALGELGSMEAIQQIDRFLEDGRNPDLDYYDLKSGAPYPHAAGHYAVYALHRALREQSPLSPSTAYRNERKLLDWWKAGGAKPYREWNHDEYEPMPPLRRRAVPLSQLKPSPSPPQLADHTAPTRLPWWQAVLIILGAATLAAAFGMRLRRI